MLEGIDISSKKLIRAPIPLATGNVLLGSFSLP